MNHLSTAELLLLAEGELDEVRAAHAAGCAACRAASEQALDELSAVTDALSATAAADSPEAQTESWMRLRAGLETPAPAHVEIEDLLLHLDGEMVPAVTAHLEDCADCHDELLRAQTLLVDVEHELRALIPEETRQQRLASAARLEQALDARRSRVLTFPAPWRAVYAAAALVAAGLFGFAWYAQQPLEMPLPTVASAPAAPAVRITPRPKAVPAPGIAEIAVAEAAAEEISATPARIDEPVRFAAPSAQPLARPQPAALTMEAAPLVAFMAGSVSLPPADLPRIEQPSMEQAQPLFAGEPTRVVVTDRPTGGVVRTALLEHYGDAARRSFRTARPDLLEGELARYVSDVLHADSELLRHAYALNEMIKSADLENLDAEGRDRLRSESRKTLSIIRAQEEQLYAKLSEALPRRYWAAKGVRDGENVAVDLETGTKTLLEAALRLDKNLSAVLITADSSVSLDAEPASIGDLLYIVRASSRNLQERLSVLR